MPDVVMTAIPKMSTDQALAADKAVRALVDGVSSNLLDLGEALRKMRQGYGWEALGYVSFEQYLEQRFHRRLRWAQQRIRAAEQLQTLPALAEAADDLGPTKTRILADALAKFDDGAPADLQERLLTSAPQLSTRDLEVQVEAEIKAAKPQAAPGATPSSGDPAPTPVRFMLFQGQQETLEAALEIAARMTESDKKGHQLEMVAADFLATYQGLPKTTDLKGRLLERLAEGLDLDIKAIDVGWALVRRDLDG